MCWLRDLLWCRILYPTNNFNLKWKCKFLIDNCWQNDRFWERTVSNLKIKKRGVCETFVRRFKMFSEQPIFIGDNEKWIQQLPSRWFQCASYWQTFRHSPTAHVLNVKLEISYELSSKLLEDKSSAPQEFSSFERTVCFKIDICWRRWKPHALYMSGYWWTLMLWGRHFLTYQSIRKVHC